MTNVLHVFLLGSVLFVAFFTDFHDLAAALNHRHYLSHMAVLYSA